MINRLDPATDTFLNDLREINRRVDRAQRQVTSGHRINTVSDSPADLTMLLQIRTELEQTSQIKQNLGRVKTEVDAGEQALQQAVSVIERASVLGTQGANSTMSTEQRLTIAGEVEGLLEQMIGLSRTTVEARFIFSGDADGTAPFTLDLTQADPVSPYQGTVATRQMMHPSGTRFVVSRTGEEIFDNADPARNVFDALNSLRVALLNDDQAAIEAALGTVKTAEIHLNSQLTFYGTVQNQVAAATDFAYRQELRLKTSLSALEDTDMTAAILELNQAQYQQEVSLTTKSRTGTRTLFDYIG